MNPLHARVPGCLIGTALAFSSLSVIGQSGAGDPHPVVSIAATTPETTEPSPNVRVMPGAFTITREGNSSEPLVLFLEFSGAAVNGQDYAELSQYVTVPQGETSVKLLVGALDDAVVEGDESVVATISANPPIDSIPNYRIDPGKNRAAVVIHDNDAPAGLPVVSLTGFAATLELCPPNALCVGVHFSLSRTGPGLDKPLTVFLNYGGTATAGVDYQALPTQATFKAGEDFAAVISAPIDDALFEGDETVVADLVAGIDYAADPQKRQATTVIQDDEAPAAPVVSLELVDADAMETLLIQNNIDWAEFGVTRTGPVTGELEVFLNTKQGSARLGEDYRLERVADGSSVRFLAGERTVLVRLYATDDAIYEGDESAFSHLIAPPPGRPLYQIDLAHSSVAMTIHDNDPVAVRLDITAPRDGQRFDAGDVIELRAQFVGPVTEQVWNIDFFAGDRLLGTTRPGAPIWWQDAPAGEHVIRARAIDALGTVIVAEPSPTIRVGPGAALPVVKIGAAPWRTGEPCPTCFVAPSILTIERTAPADAPLEVFLEMDGTAAPGADYVPLPASVQIPAGQLSTKLTLFARDDQLVEGPEVVRVRLLAQQSPTYFVNVHAGEVLVLIGEDEAGGPQARLDIIEPADGTHVRFPSGVELSALAVDLQGEIFGPVEFYSNGQLVATAPVIATALPTIPGLPSIHTASWVNPPVGQHVVTAITRVGLNTFVESPPITIIVDSGPQGTIVSIGTDDDVASEISILAVIDPARFRISRFGDLTRSERVFYSLHGSATPGVDYQEVGGSIEIPAGQSSATFDIFPKFDQIAEGIETVFVRLEPSPLMNPLASYDIDTSGDDATAVILDNGSNRTPGIEIVMPGEGEKFAAGANIEVIAAAYHPTNDIFHVDFYAGATKIGESVIVFDRAFSGGLIVHRMSWNGAPAGVHLLTARGHDGSQDPPLVSDPVRITVGPDMPADPTVSIVNPKEGAHFSVGDPISIEAVAIDLEGYISRIEFWDFDQKIGESEIVFIRAPDPGTPIAHSFEWRNAAAGAHKLSARVVNANGAVLSSQPVQITVGSGADRAMVEIEATDASAFEEGTNGALDVAVFTIRRIAGPQTIDLMVYYSIGGKAANGVDYVELNRQVLLPGGASSVQVVVKPVPDKALEGDEDVILRLESPVCIQIAPPPPECYLIGQKAEARVVIHESGGSQVPAVAIVKPGATSRLETGEPIEIVVEARDPDGYVRRIEFLADGRKLGEAGIEFIQPPEPGQLQTFSFVWQQPTPGPHVLVARAIDDDGAVGTSAPIGIKVGLSDALPLVTVSARDSFAVEPRINVEGNPASFRIHRFGPDTEPLAVAFSLTGTTQNGVDYDTLSGLATIPAGARSADVVVRPLPDLISEVVETVVLRLEAAPAAGPNGEVAAAYQLGDPREAAVVISDVPWQPVPGAAQCVPLPGNLLHLCFAAEAGQNYRVEASVDLRNWMTLADAATSDGTWHFVDTEMASHRFRFYRLVPEPEAGQ